MRRYAPDAVWDMNPLGGLGTFEGHAAMRGFWEDWYSSYEEFEIEPEEILDLGNGVTFGPVIQRARPVGSSGAVRLRYAIVAVWAEGLIVCLTNYADIDEARDAAERLAEERGSEMSQATNVEVVQAALDAFMQGDSEGVLSLCDENIEITQAAGFPGVPRKQHGHAGVLEAFDAWPEQWDDYRIEILRVADLGDHVIVTQIARGRGKGSGVQVEMPLALLFSVRSGKISEWRIFAREEEALQDACLSG